LSKIHSEGSAITSLAYDLEYGLDAVKNALATAAHAIELTLVIGGTIIIGTVLLLSAPFAATAA
jgi:hypothetical protein